MIDSAQVEGMRSRLTELEERFADPNLAANQNKYREVLREHAMIKKRLAKAERFVQLRDDIADNRALIEDPDADPELAELAQEELAGLEKAFPVAERELRVALVPEDPNDERNAIMEIRAGTGGDEAALFAGDLYRMYSRYAEEQGWKISVIDASASEVGGYKEVTYTVEGANAYKALKFESGVHRVQRVPATESSGRIHTSAATVAVFAEVEETDEIEIDPTELRIDTFCASGPGGQSVNTTYSAVRITHEPTGMVAQSQDERSQQRNREKAMAVLKARLLDVQRREEEEKMGSARRSQIGSGDRSEKTRTYNFPQNRLTDHRINLTLYSLDRIMEGDLKEIVSTLQDDDLERLLQEELAATKD